MTHILLIEDNPGDAVLIREMYREAAAMGQKYAITHVSRVKAAINLLSKPHDIDMILSDMSLPDSQGLETLKSLSYIASELPVVFMTGSDHEEFVSVAIKSGAQDYLVKGAIDSQILRRTTLYSIERKKAQNKIDKAVRKADKLEKNTELLEQQKEQLIALNAAKDEFISLASHQLRTPATAVKQYLGMILGGYVGDIPEGMEPFLNTAYNSNERQLSIINDLLKTAQLDSGRFVLDRQPHDICKLVQDAIADLKPLITMRDQKVNFKHCLKAIVNIDATELQVAVANLIENASKYSPARSTIHVDVERSDTQTIVSVQDEGVGIESKDIPRVFEKFTRLDNELSDTVNGSGLGLYFVSKITRMHNGKVTVDSTPHHGSTFALVLPS